jgi:hypothetical protein
MKKQNNYWKHNQKNSRKGRRRSNGMQIGRMISNT